MPWISLVAIAVGAVLGAWLRWILALHFNPVFPTLPLGTLAANLIGALIIGLMISLQDPFNFSPATRLFITTGFLGALTTFSTFSGETMTLLLRAQYVWAAAAAAAHLFGSLTMTAIGVLIGRALLGR
jgi:fluoride exporter